MSEYFPLIPLIATALASMGYGCAAIIREYFRGKALIMHTERNLILAQKGVAVEVDVPPILIEAERDLGTSKSLADRLRRLAGK